MRQQEDGGLDPTFGYDVWVKLLPNWVQNLACVENVRLMAVFEAQTAVLVLHPFAASECQFPVVHDFNYLHCHVTLVLKLHADYDAAV